MKSDESTVEETRSQTIENILLAAEAEFAERGFEGAGMKALSVRANVAQSLLHYHFGTKDRLYAEVIKQRSHKINKSRLALLETVDPAQPDAIDRILDALFRPPLGPEGGEKPYARIFSSLIVGRERERALVQKHYDPTARAFIQAIQSALPGSTQQTAAMCYTLALGSLIAVIGRDGRVERLMGRDDLLEVEDLLQSLISFTRGGVFALTPKKHD